MKKILLGLLICSSFMFASTQNLANISDLKESIAELIARMGELNKEVQDLKKSTNEHSDKGKKDNLVKDGNSGKKEEKKDTSSFEKDLQELKDKINSIESKENKSPSEKELVSDLKTTLENALKDINDRLNSLEEKIDESKNTQMPAEIKPRIKIDNTEEQVDNAQVQIEESAPLLDKDSAEDKEETRSVKNSQEGLNESHQESKATNQEKSCSFPCAKEEEFRNFKKTMLDKESSLRRLVDILSKRIDELSREIVEIKNYYEGS